MPEPSPAAATPWGRFALVWLLFAVLMLIADWLAIAGWRFGDPDDTLRLVQVRDLFAGQGWFDLHQHRIDPGHSPVMHWSRLVDAPLLAVIALLSPLTGQGVAEHVAVVLVPLLTLGAVIAMVWRMAFRLLGKEVATLACLACGFSPLLLTQLQPMRIDHHGWQIAALMLATTFLMHRRPWIGGAAAGFAIATGLSISLELLPLAGAIAGVFLLRWLRDPAQRGWLAGYLASLAGGLAVLFALTRGFGDPTPYCDVVSPAYLAFFAIVALGTAGLAAWSGLPRAAVIGFLGALGVVGLAVFLRQAPQCAAGPFGNLDPIVRQYWYVNILEGRPFWAQRLGGALPVAFQGFVALGATLALWRTSEGAKRSWWLDYGLILAAALLGGLLVWRSMAFVGALSAIPLGWLAHRLLARYRAAGRPAARIAVVMVAIAALLPAFPGAVVRLALPAAKPSEAFSETTCDLHGTLPQLDRLAPATIFAPIDIGPAVIERTRHSVVATAHHRAQLAIRDVIVAFTSPEAAAHAIVRRHGASYLLVCTDLAEPRFYASQAPDGLMAHLLDGDTPAWLEEVPLSAPAAFRLWRVRD